MQASFKPLFYYVNPCFLFVSISSTQTFGFEERVDTILHYFTLDDLFHRVTRGLATKMDE